MSPLIVLAVVASALLQANGFKLVPKFDDRIVGGEDADIKDFPYQLSFQSYEKHGCGASILTTTVALSAAHCAHQYKPRLSVRAGSSYHSFGGETVAVVEVRGHPLYDSVTLDYDVTILILEKPLKLDSPIPLQPIGQEVPEGTGAVVSGWGHRFSGGSNSFRLQSVEVQHNSTAKCNEAYNPDSTITDRMTCYAAEGKDSCQNDSGGPLVSGGRQVGIVSWGFGCAEPEYPGVYTNIADSSIHNHITESIE